MTGPLPAPAILEEYDRVYPGAAGIIVDQFIAQSNHRQKQESRIVLNDIIRAYIGQAIGATLAAFLIWTGGDLLRHGHSIEGFQLIGIAIAAGALPFGVRAVGQIIERKNQTQAIAQQQRPPQG